MTRFFFTIVALTALALPVTASAYDRKPVTATGGYLPDRWGQTTTGAQHNLLDRYPGINPSTLFCTGLIMGDYTLASSTWVTGVTRFWDKLLCAGYTRQGAVFGLIYDGKGKHAWIIYRLHGATINDLRA